MGNKVPFIFQFLYILGSSIVHPGVVGPFSASCFPFSRTTPWASTSQPAKTNAIPHPQWKSPPSDTDTDSESTIAVKLQVRTYAPSLTRLLGSRGGDIVTSPATNHVHSRARYASLGARRVSLSTAFLYSQREKKADGFTYILLCSPLRSTG